MDDDFEDFADEFFLDEAALAQADQAAQEHITHTQQAPPSTASLKRHVLAKPANPAPRPVARSASGMPFRSHENVVPRARTAQQGGHLGSGTNLAPRPHGAGHTTVTAPFKAPTLTVKPSALDKDTDYPDVSVTEEGKYSFMGSQGSSRDLATNIERKAGDPFTVKGGMSGSTGAHIQRITSRPGAAGVLIPNVQQNQATLGLRKPMSRSTSMGPSQSAAHHQSNPRAASRLAVVPNLITSRHDATAKPSGAQADSEQFTGSQGFNGSQRSISSFKRTNSIGESARRMAIEHAMGMLPALPEGTVPSVGHDRGADESMTSEASLVQQATAPSDQCSAADGAAAQALREEVERMRIRMEELQKERDDAEEKAKAAQQDVWKYQGEAKLIRGKFEEDVRASEQLKESMQKQVEALQMSLSKRDGDHQRAVDQLNSVSAFKIHGVLTSSSKPGRLASTQRSIMRTGTATPSRQKIANPQATPSRSPGRHALNRTPSKLGMVRSPGRLVSSNLSAKAIQPPPAPVFNDGYRTPQRGPAKAVSKPNVGFSNMAESFNVHSVTRANKRQKIIHDDGGPIHQASSPRSSPVMDTDNGAADMYITDDPMNPPAKDGTAAGVVDEDTMLDHIDWEESDVWQNVSLARVVHLVLTHTWLSRSVPDILCNYSDLADPAQPTLTLHKIMHFDADPGTPDHDQLVRAHVTYCRSILALCGECSGRTMSLVFEMTGALWNVCGFFGSARYTDTVLSLLNLLTAISRILSESTHAPDEGFSGGASDLLESLISPSPREFLASLGVTTWAAKAAKAKQRSAMGPRDSDVEIELILSYFGFLADSCLGASWLPEEIVKFASSSSGVTGVLLASVSADVKHACVNFIGSVAGNTQSQTFRWLLSNPDSSDQDPTRVPVIAGLCDLILSLHPLEQDLVRRVLSIISTLAQMDRDAAFLLGQNYHLVPALIRLLERTSDAVWGISANPAEMNTYMQVMIPALTLLHYLVFPPASEELEAPAGLDLAGRLQASTVIKELVGLHHVFVTAMGRISYAETDVLEGWSENDLRSMQDLAQDLLDVVVVGPEGDAIYEVYVSDPQPGQDDPIQPEDEERLVQLNFDEADVAMG